MMELNLPIYTFNSYGGSSAFGSVIVLVGLHEESFGDSLQEILLRLYFKSGIPFFEHQVIPSLQDSYDKFHNQQCAKLPIHRFMRKKRKLKMEVLASFLTAEKAIGDGLKHHTAPLLRLEWEHIVLDILIRELKACKKKFKTTDDFRFDDFLDWLRRQHENLPKTIEERNHLDQVWLQKGIEKRQQLDEWELLGLDWEEFHEAAREVVADSRLWCRGHDFAPNGNDNGADLFSFFQSKKMIYARDGGKSFYRDHARNWGFDPKAVPNASVEYTMKRESIIGLAFAFLKLFAYCPQWLADESIETIEGFKDYLALHHSEWDNCDLCLEYQDAMLECLEACPRK